MRQQQLFEPENRLYEGDNLKVLRNLLRPESVDLVYLDPPFKSNQDYNVLFKERDGRRSASQIKAFGDTWRWDQAAADSYRDTIENGPERVGSVMQAFRAFLGETDMLAYLSMMSPRLIEMWRVLKPTGSIFLHCDPTASHYLKMLMDAVFGPSNFRNEIVWCYTGPGSPNIKQFLRKHDIVFWYSMGKTWTFNADEVREAHSDKTKANYKSGLKGSGFVGADHVIHEKGKVPEDWWQMAIAPRGKEYLRYPTQKPRRLLERIITAASNEDDTILDPFCGCGTSIDAAVKLRRKWMGIDITRLAIDTIKKRLDDQYGEEIRKTYKVIRNPESLTDARALADDDKYEFQWWVLDLVEAQKAPHKKGADKGIDGRIYFHDDKTGPTRQVLISVKGGVTGPAHVRDLRGVIEREKAAIGVLVTMKEPTRQMRAEAAGIQPYRSKAWDKTYPRLQILTVAQLLEGKRIDYPGTDWYELRQELPFELRSRGTVAEVEETAAEVAEPQPEAAEKIFKKAAASKTKGKTGTVRIGSRK